MLLIKENEKIASMTIRRNQIWEINKIYNKSLLPVGIFDNEYTLRKNKERDADLLNEMWINDIRNHQLQIVVKVTIYESYIKFVNGLSQPTELFSAYPIKKDR